ncbi:hypothetical protein NUACC21_19200 [Scytonema sp. NUACC21]
MVNKVFNTQLMAERIESLKAGVLASVCLTFAFHITNLLNSLILVKYFNFLNILQMDTLNLQWLTRSGIAAFCSLLFGVTGIESILGFGLAGLALDIALQFGWIKTFK